MDSKHIAAAHAATPTCNAGADQPFTCHSLACRTVAIVLVLRAASVVDAAVARPARPRLTVLRGGKAVR